MLLLDYLISHRATKIRFMLDKQHSASLTSTVGVDTKGLQPSLSHKILVMIVIATFLITIMFLKKKDHWGITNIMSQTGPNITFEII